MDRKRSELNKLTTEPSPDTLAEDLAAARIQAGFRGYRFRKQHPELTHTGTTKHATTKSTSQSSSSIRHLRADEPHEMTPGTAATRIQAGFRGYQTRKHLHEDHKPVASNYSTQVQNSHHSLEPDLAAAKIQAGFRGYRTRKDLRARRNHPQELRVSHLDEIHSDPNYAATRIQATFRGYQTRRALHGSDQSSVNQTRTPLSTQNRNPAKATGNDSLLSERLYSTIQDPLEANKAATVIQAGFRGYQTRKHLHPTNYNNNSNRTTYPETYRTNHVNKENAEQAATRIQAAYRGFATRKHLHQSDPVYPGRASENVGSIKTHYTDPSEAATKIQATFRGYRTRQHVHVPHTTTSSTNAIKTSQGLHQT